MLLKSKISQTEIYSDEWFQRRLGKMTASRWDCLSSERGIGSGGLNYIRQKVGEELTGKLSDKFVDTDAIRWGHFYESEALRKFAEVKQIDFLVTGKLISDPETRFACTPDALIAHAESEDKQYWNVSTVEAKCFPSYDHYIQMAECDTPEQVKQADSQVFWQTIFQMSECDALFGYNVFYHPDFKAGGLRIIEYRKAYLREYFKILAERKDQALQHFERIRLKLLSIKN